MHTATTILRVSETSAFIQLLFGTVGHILHTFECVLRQKEKKEEYFRGYNKQKLRRSNIAAACLLK